MMPQDSNSLDRLNDIVIPQDVSWWPLAPGWYVLFGLLLIVAGWLLWRAADKWRANAYRRMALRELATLKDAASIAELLRRTALVVIPRAEVASSTGKEWVDWLATQSPVTVSPEVRHQLSRGVYQRETELTEVNLLRDFAMQWISLHQTSSSES